MLRDVVRERDYWQKDFEDYIAQARAGGISHELITEALGPFRQAMQEMEESLIEVVMNDSPIPTSRSHPEYSKLLLQFPANSRLTNIPLQIGNVSLATLSTAPSVADGVFEHLRTVGCAGYEEIRDSLWNDFEDLA